MSAFLGKIHYWLYDKIMLHEALIEHITAVAEQKGYQSVTLLEEGAKRYGAAAKGELEAQIDHGNIHGWLQQKIVSVESRLAYIATTLLEKEILSDSDLEKIFAWSGTDAMQRLELSDPTPSGLFQAVFDHMLEGMPCDNVNKVIENNESMLSWKTTRDLHEHFWSEVGGDPKIHCRLRGAWIDGFLGASGAGYRYERTADHISTIRRV